MKKALKVSIDSRLIKPGEYFVPVKGDVTDGHKYIDIALQNGAAGIIEENELYKLASKKLAKIKPIVIAVTGSVGKSTMVGFIVTLLSQKFKVCKGSLNTKLGLAVNIINDMKSNDQIFVAETGMDRAGELLETGNFISPYIAVITNVSKTHMEKLGSFENIKKAKGELLQTIRQGGCAFINWDNVGAKSISKYVPKSVSLRGYKLCSEDNDKPFNLIGKHNKVLACGAIEIAKFFKLSPKEISEGIKSLRTPKGRLAIIAGINNSIIIDDSYNSSPVSVRGAFEAVCSYYKCNKMKGRKIAILGGALELGSYEDKGHKEIGNAVANFKFNDLVLVGKLARKIQKSSKLQNSKTSIHFCKDNMSAGNFVKDKLKPQKSDIILVKASQGIRLEKTVEILMKYPNKAPELLVRQDARWK